MLWESFTIPWYISDIYQKYRIFLIFLIFSIFSKISRYFPSLQARFYSMTNLLSYNHSYLQGLYTKQMYLNNTQIIRQLYVPLLALNLFLVVLTMVFKSYLPIVAFLSNIVWMEVFLISSGSDHWPKCLQTLCTNFNMQTMLLHRVTHPWVFNTAWMLSQTESWPVSLVIKTKKMEILFSVVHPSAASKPSFTVHGDMLNTTQHCWVSSLLTLASFSHQYASHFPTASGY